MARRFTKEETECALEWMTSTSIGRSPLRPQPTQYSPQVLRTESGLRFADFARFCIWFRRPNLVKPIFNNLIQPLIDRGFDFITSLTSLSRTLRKEKHWNLIVDLFAHAFGAGQHFLVLLQLVEVLALEDQAAAVRRAWLVVDHEQRAAHTAHVGEELDLAVTVG